MPELPMAKFVTPDVALTHWMAEHVPVKMRGGHTDPAKIVEHAYAVMRGERPQKAAAQELRTKTVKAVAARARKCKSR